MYSWRLRRVHEAALAEADEWWWYPNGRQYYTSLRQHMKELVDELIAEAVAKGFVSTRQKPGPKCASPIKPSGNPRGSRQRISCLC